MKNYTWAWNDDAGLHLNQCNSLAAIVQFIIECYVGNEAEVIVKTIETSLNVQFPFDEVELVYEVKSDAINVCKFLHHLSRKFDLKDQFVIIENNYEIQN